MSTVVSFLAIWYLEPYVSSTPVSLSPAKWFGGINDASHAGGASRTATDAGNAVKGGEGASKEALQGTHIDPTRYDNNPLFSKVRLAGKENRRLPAYLKQSSSKKLTSLAKNSPPMAPVRPPPTTLESIQDLGGYISQVLNYMRKYAPKLYRRLEILMAGLKLADMRGPVIFAVQFQIASVRRKITLLAETFESLRAQRIFRTSKQFEAWAQTIGKVMNLQDFSKIPDITLVKKLNEELALLFSKAEHEPEGSPLHQALPEFKSLQKALDRRVSSHDAANARESRMGELSAEDKIFQRHKIKLQRPVERRPANTPETIQFEKEFENAELNDKITSLEKAFKSLKTSTVSRPEKELKSWAGSIGNVMKVENSNAVQPMILEGKVLVELSELIITKSKEEANSPWRRSLESFVDLYGKLFRRLDRKREAWIKDTGYEHIDGARELLNVDEMLFYHSAEIEPFGKRLAENHYIGKLFDEVRSAAKDPDGKTFQQGINKLIALVEDKTLSLPSNEHIVAWRGPINSASLQERSSAATALWFLNEAASTNKGIEFSKNNQEYVKQLIYTKFAPHAPSDDFLYPHFKKLFLSVYWERSPHPVFNDDPPSKIKLDMNRSHQFWYATVLVALERIRNCMSLIKH
ncbi:hypothetical protein O181_066974 [Austropuccinia psidii MF-1]|uniref:Uncharacterized protein n=1 Tax=Austropuccinia psidii MF-1 TaxID=1389203 RepID=A0A9Q3I624_9BASI|nr:hypothetical protein [Austropuccinia psidii MF-1]